MGCFGIASLGYWRVIITSPPADDSVVALAMKPCLGTLESSTESIAMAQKIHTYTDLLQKIHDDLRIQHPEWIQRNGESPLCDSYEARLMELLDASRPMDSNETTAVSH